jgi:aryl-alcohol dehydrogenase-like predicted oxidoreductase
MTSCEHLEANFAAMNIKLSDELVGRLENLISRETIHGPRSKPETQAEIDTEEYA